MRKKRLLAAVFVTALLLSGCGRQKTETAQEEKEAVTIPAVFLIDPATGLSSNRDFVDEFNEEYEGEYRIEAEWLTDSAAGYREKLKQWNVLDEMPAIITDAGFDYDFYRLLAENDRLVNLEPYMEEAPAWKDAMNPSILEECTEPDGSVYLSPLATGVQAYAGIIYNKELLAGAGYYRAPETWEEFEECLKRLQEKEITPLALHGSGSYWVPMLFATSYMEGTAAGKEFLHRDFPESFQTPEMEQLLDCMKELYRYTYPDALDIDYSEAARRFCDGKAAMIANGYWMFAQMPPDAQERSGFAPFPGNILMNAPRMTAWAVTTGYDAEVTAGAVKALEFRIRKDVENTEKLLNKKAMLPLEMDYAKAARNVETIMPNYQMKWEQELQNEFFTEQMPLFLNSAVTKQEFLRRMDSKVQEINGKK